MCRSVAGRSVSRSITEGKEEAKFKDSLNTQVYGGSAVLKCLCVYVLHPSVMSIHFQLQAFFCLSLKYDKL